MSMMDGLSNITGTVGPNGMIRQTSNRVVAFYTGRKQNGVKSQENGAPFYEDCVMFKSFMPGEQRYEMVERPATEQDKRSWPMQWQAFTQNREHVPEGFPIENLFPEKPSIAANLKGIGVYTIEQCAEMNATAMDSIMGGQSFVNEAKRYLEVAAKGVSVHKFRKELEDRDSKIRVLTTQVEQLVAQVNKLQTNEQAIDPAVVQQVLAQLQGGPNRPVMPAANLRGQRFDAQTAQINATSVQTEIAQRKTSSPRRRKSAASEG
jgi:hypothetical protein